MRIVIDIEDSYYNWIINNKSNDPHEYKNATELRFRKAVERGIVIPENCSDLIDRDSLVNHFNTTWYGDAIIEIRKEPAVVHKHKGMCFNCKYKTDTCQEGLHCIRDAEDAMENNK